MRVASEAPGKGRREVQRPDPGDRHLEGHTDQTPPQPTPVSQMELFAARPRRRAAGGGALTSPREADLSGRGGAGRARFRAEPEAPTVAASGTASGLANPTGR